MSSGLLALFALSHVGAAEIAFKLADPKGAAVADAVVYLTRLDAPAPVVPPSQPVEIGQTGQEFQAFVTPVIVGTTVEFPNRDDCEHHVYSLSPAKKFTLPLYKPGKSGSVTFDRPGVVAIGCNIHDWMLTYVVVLDTPWFVRSALDGTASLKAMPPGRYRIEVWHPRLSKSETREITLTEAAAASQTFTLALKPDRRIRRHPLTGDSSEYR